MLGAPPAAALRCSSSADFDEENGDFGGSESEEEAHAPVAHDGCEIDSDEEHRRYDDHLDEMLNEAYERYMSKKGGSAKQQKRAKQAHSNDKAELFEGGDDEVQMADHDSDQEQNDKEANPLMIPIQEDEQPNQEQITLKWFSQDVFAEAADEAILEKSDSEDERKEEKFSKYPKRQDQIFQCLLNPNLHLNKTLRLFQQSPRKRAMTDSSDDSSSEEESDLDDSTKGEILAYAKKMSRKK